MVSRREERTGNVRRGDSRVAGGGKARGERTGRSGLYDSDNGRVSS